MSTQGGSTLAVALGGTALDGIRIPGSVRTRLFRATEYSTALLVGVSIRRS
jgi:hypothetical protein